MFTMPGVGPVLPTPFDLPDLSAFLDLDTLSEAFALCWPFPLDVDDPADVDGSEQEAGGGLKRVT